MVPHEGRRFWMSKSHSFFIIFVIKYEADLMIKNSLGLQTLHNSEDGEVQILLRSSCSRNNKVQNQ